MLLATIVFVFTITWCVWLWVIMCCPKRWALWVDNEHAIMARMGLIPTRWFPIMRRLQTGFFMKGVIALTIVIALLVQEYR
jgi:hypothetical protein